MGHPGEKVIPVRVAVRSRPLLQWELSEGAKECVNFINEAQQVIVNSNRAFTFDYVFNPHSEQEKVYQKAVLPLIDGIFKGYNGTVLAYGQTGSGKTYSMGSAHCVSQCEVTDLSSGIIPRVIKDIFDGIEKRTTHEFLVKVSYVEIYKEELKDLLSNSRKQTLTIRENIDGSIRIAGLTEALVASAVDTLDYMERGNAHRSTGSTAMNATSSRSHAIFTIILESRSINDPDELTCSKFHLVDLAGSERAKRTRAEGERLQEGIKINAGLLALGNVISALGEGQHGQHIPYRVSKLTRLLQDSLGGNSLTVMIACISPADSNAEETINTLRYADRARKIKNKAVVNRDPVTAELVSLRKEVQQLRLKLLETSGTTSVERDSPKTHEQLTRLEGENQQLMEEMQKLLDSNTELCEKAINNDMALDNLQSWISDLQTEARDVATNPHDLSLAEEAVEETIQRECVQKLRNLRTKLLEKQMNEQTDTTEDMVTTLTRTLEAECDDTPNTSADGTLAAEGKDHNAVKTEHLLKTAKLTNQLQELTKALSMKEELAKKMSANEENIGAWRNQYEERLTKLDKELLDLQNERDNLAVALEAATKTNESKKLSERRRVRLTELENQIKELKLEKKEKEKMSKLKAQSDQKITQLNSDIQSMKSYRVKLMRQIKEESSKFQTWRKEKEREVKQLKEKNRKRQFEIVKLERDFQKQKNVLRRKTEEAAASNRRLKDALSKQKAAAAKRQQSQTKTLDSANTRMKVWLEEDIEIALRSKEAKKHLDTLEEDLRSVQGQLDELARETASQSKRRRTYAMSDLEEAQRRKRELGDECELKVAQIKDLRSKLADARDTRTRQQARFIQITSIAEARSIMKHLFCLMVSTRMSEEEIKTEVKSLNDDLRCAQSQLKQLESELATVKRDRDTDINTIEDQHQEQLVFLAQQLNKSASDNLQKSMSEREADLSMQIKLQGTVIEQLLRKGDEYEAMRRELEEKFKDPPLTKLPARPSLFQPIVEEADTKLKNPKSKQKKHKSAASAPIEMSSESEDEDEISDYYDSDYVPTPILRKRQRATLKAIADKCRRKYCSCAKTHCAGRCACRKAGLICTEQCKCEKKSCKNTENSLLSESSSASFETVSSGSLRNSTFIASPEDAPYYNRMPALFDSESSPQARSSIERTSVSADKKYRAIYFTSPLQNRDTNVDNEVPNSAVSAEPAVEKVTAKVIKSKAVARKRKLLPQPNAVL
ncbi:unnamed protein product [Clavelina lepadiformis]|uniref:Kinesin motor domain-containing protein n=1 Tax=Clavelina lepadiformis TaxID=159417 RepID=A0ABP0G7I0_CLALP